MHLVQISKGMYVMSQVSIFSYLSLLWNFWNKKNPITILSEVHFMTSNVVKAPPPILRGVIERDSCTTKSGKDLQDLGRGPLRRR